MLEHTANTTEPNIIPRFRNKIEFDFTFPITSKWMHTKNKSTNLNCFYAKKILS